MTDRQIKSVQTKIDKIKKALAADKRRWGGQYDDSRGLRYLPPELYLKIQDYSGALKYFNWFNKNFPDDCGYPDFMFEWTITLFYNSKLKDAEKKAYETFFSNSYYFDKFFNKPIIPIDKYEFSNWQYAEMTDAFLYSADQPVLNEFTSWLTGIINSENFIQTSRIYIELCMQLKDEPVGPRRSEIMRRMDLVEKNCV